MKSFLLAALVLSVVAAGPSLAAGTSPITVAAGPSLAAGTSPITVAAGPSRTPTPALRFAVIADQTGSAMPGVYDSVLAEVARLDPDFVVTVGDHVQGYVGPDTATLRTELEEVFAQYDRAFGPRWRSGGFLAMTPGNHDITDDMAEPLWREKVGPPFRRVDLAGVTVLITDTTRMPDDGTLPPEQVAFLERELAGVRPEQPVLVLTHKPFFANGVWKGKDDPLHRLFVQHGVDAVLAGHWHNYLYEPRDGVVYMVCGSSGGATGGEGLENGEFIGFLWGTIRGGSVSLTPVSLGSVHARDMMNLAENTAVNAFTTRGLALSPFELGGGAQAAGAPAKAASSGASTVTVIARNPGDRATSDSLRWTVPPNWTVTPRVAPFAAAAGESAQVRFEASYAGSPFPLPSLATVLHYGRGKAFASSVPLRIVRTAQCPSAAKIKVDGVVRDQEWAGSSAETLFMSPEGGESTADPAEFLFAHDDGGIYLAARCAVGADHPVKASVTKRDGPISQEDCAGWFLCPSDSVIVQIYANPLGTVIDGRGTMVGGDARMDYKWNAKCRVAASRGADRWSVEVYVPFETLGLSKGAKPADLLVNFRRKQPAVQSSADWMPIAFDPATMGKMVVGWYGSGF